MTLDLTNGICKTEQYEAWKFPGGEIHFIFKIEKFNFIDDEVLIKTRLNTSDDIMLLLIATDTIKKDFNTKIYLYIPYMPYQQADINFGLGECFSLKTITNLINFLKFDGVYVFDPHSPVTPALLDNCTVFDNSDFIFDVINKITDNSDELIILSPDAGAFKKIFKLCEKIEFKGEIVTCSKSRNHDTGNLVIIVPEFDSSKNVLIIDDICLAGNTFLNIREKIKNENVYLAVSHGIFNDNVERLKSSFKKIYTTNSRRSESIDDSIEIIDIF